MNKKKVAFICVHNSCRSQIAEALGKHLASDVFESYSAGTETKLQINQDAVRIMKELYGIDMEAEGQYSKLIDEIPVPDIAISMGCNVGCPFIERPFDDNWGLEDPTGKSDEEFKKVIDEIRMQIFIFKQLLDDFEETKEVEKLQFVERMRYKKHIRIINKAGGFITRLSAFFYASRGYFKGASKRHTIYRLKWRKCPFGPIIA